MRYNAVACGDEQCIALRAAPAIAASKPIIASGAGLTNLNASKIDSGTLAASLIPGLDASKITTGTLAASQIPSLDAGTITTGTLPNARTTGTNLNTPDTLVLRDANGDFAANIISASLSGNATSATTAANAVQLNGQPAAYYTNAGNISTGVLSAAQIPNLDASKITSGILANARTSGSVASAANALVLRDVSGNFSAATITAALNGNAITATTAANSTQLNGQAASFYTAANNIVAGTLADARLSSNIPLKNAANAFTSPGITSFAGNVGIGTTTPIQALDVNGRMNLTNGVIQRGGAAITGTSDLGLYSQVPGNFMRFVTNSGEFRWYADSGGGTADRMILYPSGNLSVVGSLSKGGGSFKIDHPLDPQNKFLYHSFVESPDMMNIYNGNIVTDAAGYATITLPDYFEALNRDFRYQLTVIGQFAQAIVDAEISGNHFAIRTDKPNVKVSWQVTGIRHDAWANKNRIPTSVEKTGGERGKLLHPDAPER